MHCDLYSIFGSVIVVIDETPDMPLQLYTEDPLPAVPSSRDFIIIDPSVKHAVPAGSRDKHRRSLVFNF